MRKMISILVAMMILPAAVQAETIKASVNGLVCAFCATGIERTFRAQDAVNTVHVDLNDKLVTITTKNDQVMDDATITKLITDAGYSVTNIKRAK